VDPAGEGEGLFLFWADPDLLNIHEFKDAVGAKLSSESRSFDTATGQPRIGFDQSVDDHLTGLNFSGHRLATALFGPD
jgi:hypothetical protein